MITFENMHRIYDPMLSGYPNIVKRYYNLVQLGIEPSLARFLGRKYLNHALSQINK